MTRYYADPVANVTVEDWAPNEHTDGTMVTLVLGEVIRETIQTPKVRKRLNETQRLAITFGVIFASLALALLTIPVVGIALAIIIYGFIGINSTEGGFGSARSGNGSGRKSTGSALVRRS